MSPKAEKPGKRSTKKGEEEPKPAQVRKERAARPRGADPTAMVSSRRGQEMVERQGRGFSIGELEGADLPLALARRWKLPMDLRRRSVLGWNIGSLKKWYVAPSKPPEPKAQPEEAPKKAGKVKAEKVEKTRPEKRAPRKQAAKKPKRSPRT
ncbi:MAG: hypothetical protein LYZ70_00410 [Nitrososphaerales archaeon]|nr:hypothetical protein [Nitrososphaerales archaeon]